MIRFKLFNIPISVHGWFFLLTAVLGGALRSNNTPSEWQGVIVFMVAAFVSILIHELGHAFTGLKFGAPAAYISLHGLGGAAAFPGAQLSSKHRILLTAAGPYADIMDYGQRRAQECCDDILNVSVLGNFAFTDTPENGLAIVVTAKSDLAKAQSLAKEIGEKAWADRERYNRVLTSIEDAVDIADKAANNNNLPPVIFSDAGDNPGGGGEGRTTWLLDALIKADARHVYFGAFFDKALALEAHEHGIGTTFTAQFNRDIDSEFSKPLQVEATVKALSDGNIIGRLGLYQGQALELGPSAALQIGGDDGITAIVISARKQPADPMFFEAFGLDIAKARCVCVKSRGHFRAGFLPWFPPENVYEVDTLGLTSPVLDRFNWKGLPRPVYPMDPETQWLPPNW